MCIQTENDIIELLTKFGEQILLVQDPGHSVNYLRELIERSLSP